MASALAAKIRKAREFSFEANGLALTLRRPTRVEYVDLVNNSANHIRFAEDFVVNWKGVKESDLVPSGGDVEVPFDHAVWVEFVADRSDLWEPIANAVAEAFRAHLDASEDREKN